MILICGKIGKGLTLVFDQNGALISFYQFFEN